MRGKILFLCVALVGLLLTPLSAEAKIFKCYCSQPAASAPTPAPIPAATPAPSPVATDNPNCDKEVVRCGPGICPILAAAISRQKACHQLKCDGEKKQACSPCPATCKETVIHRCHRRCQHRHAVCCKV